MGVARTIVTRGLLVLVFLGLALAVSLYFIHRGNSGQQGEKFQTVSNLARQKSSSSAQGKTTICHSTGSEKNPFVELTVSDEALKAHRKHRNDIIPAPPGGCPGPYGSS
jgi:hypothetical protein